MSFEIAFQRKANTEGVERETSLGTIHPGNVLRTTLPS